MKSKSIIKILIFIGMILISMIVVSNQSNASSFTVTSSASSVNVGDNYTITIKGDNVTGKFSIKGNENVSINSSTSVWIENNSASVSVTAKSTGTGIITVTAIDVADSTTGDVVSGTKSSNVTIKEKTTAATPPTTTTPQTTTTQKSSNNNLSNLGIKPNDFSGFKPGTTSYNVTVPNDVTEVQVYATAQDSKSKISGTGKVQLQEGKNQIKVTCKAENGSNKTYTINVTRSVAEQQPAQIQEEPEQTTEENQLPEEKNLKIESITVEGLELIPEFSSDIFEYTINLNNEDTEKLNIEAKSNYEQAKITITGNENLKTGINTIIIEAKLEESDKTVKYTLNVNKPEPESVTDEITKLKEEARTRNILLVIISVIMIISITFNILNLVKRKY